ncbi:uncharacterized protein LOC131848794 [Achroia grisella]|uniref:uncharacterized protein LOC131848794 n=1 Tax=Achroia grisella TaxID=688607 RepID=UPI0027D2D72E|nr:uncharacterized protein LOC131848794 [Achroia grisella]
MANNEDLLCRKRSAMKAKLTNFSNFITVLLSCESISDLQRIELEGRLSKFDALFGEFDELQLEIEVLADNPEGAYAERTKFEERYHSLAAQARLLLGTGNAACAGGDGGSVAGSSNKNTGQSFQNGFIRMPTINLPHYDGSYNYWLEYRETYLSLIHNSSAIDDISKFHYLRASLKGSAKEIIKNIDFKGDNYQMAWSLLCDRYDNSRLLVHNHVQALFNVDKLPKESHLSLRSLIDSINKNIRALKTLNEPTDSWDTLIVYMMSCKLDPITSRNWEEYRNTLDTAPTLSQFCKFISNKADLLETLENNNQNHKIIHKLDNKQKSFIVATNNYNNHNNNHNSNQISYNKTPLKCPLCFKHHLLYTCESFRNLSIESRVCKSKELNVCMNCLRTGHITSRCRLSRCKYCKGKHNTLLHVDDQTMSTSINNSMPSSSSSVALPIDIAGISSTNCPTGNVALSCDTIIQNTTSSILLSTAMVKVVSDDGEKFDARILLDNGSTANFITQTLSNKLRLPRRNINSTITGINSQTSNSTQSCNLTIISLDDNFKINIDCYILPEITKLLPPTSIDIRNIPIPSNLQLADPSFYCPSPIDILVGAEVFWAVLGSASIKLGKNQPTLYASKFGWIVTGPVIVSSKSFSTKQSHYCNLQTNELNLNLNKFWELDSVPLKYSLSPEERACEESFRTNTTRNKDGRFMVTYPLKDNCNTLGNSYEMAKRRFL